MKKLLGIILFLLWASNSQAATWYVGKFGSTGNPGLDSNDCIASQNPATPKLTINNALDNCFSYVLGGGATHVLEISAGTYVENLDRLDNWPRGSSMNIPFTMRGKAGDTVIIRPNSGTVLYINSDPTFVPFNMVVEGLTFDGINSGNPAVAAFGAPAKNEASGGTTNVRFIGNRFINTNLCTSNALMLNGLGLEIINNEFVGATVGDPTGCGAYLIYGGGSAAIFEGNTFSGFPYYAVHIFQTTGCPSDTIHRNNIYRDQIGDQSFDAAIVTCGSGHKLHNNLIYNVRGGIDAFINLGQTGIEYHNNIIYNASRFCIHYWSGGVSAKNNICYNPGSTPTINGVPNTWFYNQGSGQPIDASHNLCFAAGAPGVPCNEGTDNLNVNPLLADPANGDLRPCRGVDDPHPSCASTSQAIDAGTDVSSALGCTIGSTCRDFDGDLIVLPYSMGAHDEQALTWYVSTTGNNANTCDQAKNPSTPKQTITNMLDNCFTYTAGAGANKVVELAGGVYTEQLVRFFDWPKGSSATERFTLRGKAGETAIIRPNSDTQGLMYFHDNDLGGPFYLTLSNITIDKINANIGFSSAINVFASHVRFDGITLQNVNKGCGILSAGNIFELMNSTIRDGTYTDDTENPLSGGDTCYPVYANGANTLIENNHIFNFPRFGLHIYKTSGCPSNAVVRYNRLHDGGQTSTGSGDAAILICGSGNKAYHNEIWNVDAGIDMYSTPGGNAAYNNTIYNFAKFCIASSSATHTTTNNICQNPSAPKYGYIFDWNGFGSQNTRSNNLCWPGACNSGVQGEFAGTNDLNLNPLLVDPPNADLRPCRDVDDPHDNCTGTSPALNAGTDVSAAIGCTIGTDCRDFNGNLVVAPYSIGATDEPGTIDPPDPPVEPDPAIVVRLSCDNVVTDLSGNNNHGTLTNGATYATGKYHQGCSFDGVNDNVTIGAHSTLDLTHGFTLAGWVTLDSVANNSAVIVKNPSQYFLFASIDGYCGDNAVMAGFATEGGGVWACYSTPLTTGVPTHLAATYDRSLIKIYVNKVLVTQAVATAFINTGTGSMQMGGSVFSEHLDGIIDEPLVANYAFTAGEIATLADTPINPLDGPVGTRFGAGGLKLGPSGIKLR